MNDAAKRDRIVRRVARELRVRQTRAKITRLVGADRRRRRKQRCATRRDQIVLVNSITAHADRSDQHDIPKHRPNSR